MKARRRMSGFTLLELVFVVAIVAILAGLAFPSYRDDLDRARSSAFLLQLDAWREKAAIEAQANGADLCRWDDKRYGTMRESIFGQASLRAATFGDFQFSLTPRPVGDGPSGGAAAAALQPFVVDVVATASEGERALNVARLLRHEVERAGLRHVSPATDRDLPSMQSFSVLLGNCKPSAGATSVPAVAVVVKPGQPAGPTTLPPQLPPGGTAGVTGIKPPDVAVMPDSAASHAAPQLPAASAPSTSMPSLVPQRPPLPPQASGGGTNPKDPLKDPPMDPPKDPPQAPGHVTPPGDANQPLPPATLPQTGAGGQAPSSTGSSVGPVNPPVCTGGRQPSADGQRCECRIGNWNVQHQRCVGNNRH